MTQNPELSSGVPDEGAHDEDLSLLGHLAELRRRIFKGLLSILPGFIVAYNFSGPIMDFLIRPLKAALPPGQGLIATGLPDTFFIHLKLGLWGGLLFSSPLWFYQMWAFVAPGLYRRERRRVLGLALGAAILLLGGALFAYFIVFPLAFRFFISYTNETVLLWPVITQYLALIMTMLLAFGLAFQLPLALMFLARIGLVNADTLRRFRRYAVLAIVILSALLTPPDVVSQILMAIPMMGLYEISIWLISRSGRTRKHETAESGPPGKMD